jgi:hypothetical protein
MRLKSARLFIRILFLLSVLSFAVSVVMAGGLAAQDFTPYPDMVAPNMGQRAVTVEGKPRFDCRKPAARPSAPFAPRPI